MIKIEKVVRPINKIIIHCSATPENRDVDVKKVRKWHMKENGWIDVGYHYFIKLDGSIEAGRPIELIGSHTRGYNKGSIGICYAGGMNKSNTKPKDTRTDEQKEGLVNLINKIKEIYPDITIHGHNEFSDKACPSFSVADEGY